jgi:prepilin peptidase CpaA
MISFLQINDSVLVYILLLALLLMSAIIDIKVQKIPNWLVVIIILIGLLFNMLSLEGIGVKAELLGLGAGFLIMLPGYLLAKQGAGDVKLVAAIGSVVGLMNVLHIALYSFLIMGVISFFYIALKGDLFKWLVRYKAQIYGCLFGQFSYQQPSYLEASTRPLPMAPSIMLATAMVLLPLMGDLGFLSILMRYLPF